MINDCPVPGAPTPAPDAAVLRAMVVFRSVTVLVNCPLTYTPPPIWSALLLLIVLLASVLSPRTVIAPPVSALLPLTVLSYSVSAVALIEPPEDAQLP